MKKNHEIDWLLQNELTQACQTGCMESVKCLARMHNVDIKAQDDNAFIVAGQSGHLDIVKYLLTSPELSDHADIHAQEDHVLLYAAYHGNMEMVRYLLTSPELSEHANIHAGKKINSLMMASYKGHLDIVKYLLTSPELKEHADMHAKDGKCMVMAYQCKQNDVVNFLLYDMKMACSPEMVRLVGLPSRKDFALLFEKRDLFHKLHQSMNTHKLPETTAALCAMPVEEVTQAKSKPKI